MALTAYERFRFLWGAVDFTTDQEGPTYDAGTTEAGLTGAAFARRCTVEWERWGGAVDPAQTHLDFVNITAGALDSTWTGADFATVEGLIDTFWAAIKSYFPDELHLKALRWYRLGPGATPPEPAVRMSTRDVAGTSTSSPMPQQVGSTISWRTGLRKRWGRSYLPSTTVAQIGGDGNYLAGFVDAMAAAASALVTGAAAADFRSVVYSPTLQRAYNVEHVVVDSIPDIQRRRRMKGAGYKKTLP